MDIKNKIKNIELKLDLSKKFNYKFNKIVFNIAIFLMLIIVLMVWVQYDYSSIIKVHYYVECDENICSNPFYTQCSKNSIGLRPLDCRDIDPMFYENKYLYRGQSIGDKPTWLMNNSINLISFIFLLAIVFNHLLFNKDKVKRGLFRWEKKKKK